MLLQSRVKQTIDEHFSAWIEEASTKLQQRLDAVVEEWRNRTEQQLRLDQEAWQLRAITAIEQIEKFEKIIEDRAYKAELMVKELELRLQRDQQDVKRLTVALEQLQEQAEEWNQQCKHWDEVVSITIDSLGKKWQQELPTIIEKITAPVSTISSVTRNPKPSTPCDIDLNNPTHEASAPSPLSKFITQLQCDRVRLNVGGVAFETLRSTLSAFPDTLLGAMFSPRNQSLVKHSDEFFFDRDPALFPSILNFYRSGGRTLTPPAGVDLQVWQQELEFWNLPATTSGFLEKIGDALWNYYVARKLRVDGPRWTALTEKIYKQLREMLRTLLQPDELEKRAHSEFNTLLLEVGYLWESAEHKTRMIVSAKSQGFQQIESSRGHLIMPRWYRWMALSHDMSTAVKQILQRQFEKDENLIVVFDLTKQTTIPGTTTQATFTDNVWRVLVLHHHNLARENSDASA